MNNISETGTEGT